MLIRTNSILKLDLLFTETTAERNRANSMTISITRTIATIMDSYDLIQYIINNMKAKKENDSEQARILTPDKHGSSFICCTDQDEDGEEDETQAHTSISCSSSSKSISSKTTITNYLGIHQYASTNCTDAAVALVEQRISYQIDDDNQEDEAEEHLNHDWMIQDAADSNAADHVDQGSFVSSNNLNQQQQHNNEDDDTDSVDEYKQRQEEEWFKGTLFYEDPGTPPSLPPKDYITINHSMDFVHKKMYSESMYQEPTSSPSSYSLATSQIGTSIKSRRRTITGKVRNALKRKSIFSRA